MAMTGPTWQLNLIASLSIGLTIFRSYVDHYTVLHTCKESVSYNRLVLYFVTPIARVISTRSGSFRSITSSSVSCLIFLMSHHLIVLSVDAEKNSVLVLDWIQSAWFAGFLSRIVREKREKKRERRRLQFGSETARSLETFYHDGRNCDCVYETYELQRSVTLIGCEPLYKHCFFRTDQESAPFNCCTVFWIINAEMKPYE